MPLEVARGSLVTRSREPRLTRRWDAKRSVWNNAGGNGARNAAPLRSRRLSAIGYSLTSLRRVSALFASCYHIKH